MAKKEFLNNITCSGQEEMIQQFLDGALDPPERDALVIHLRHCSACQTMLVEFEALFGELAALETVAAPDRLVDRVMDRLPAGSSPEPTPRPGRLSLLVVASQIIISLGLLLVLWPAEMPIFGSQALKLPWLILTPIFSSLANWLSALFLDVSQGAQQLWPPEPAIVSLNISLDLGIGLAVGLGLAWLVGNVWLLRRYPFPTKNGGT